MSRKSFQNTKMEVKRLKTSVDAIGGSTQTKITVYTVPCRVRRLEANEANEAPVGGKDGNISTHRIYCDEINIKHSDECIISKKIYDVNTINSTSTKDGYIQVDVTYRG